VKVVDFDICQNALKRPLGYHKTYVSFVITIHLTTYTERLTKIGLIVADFCRLVQKGAVVTLAISGVTGPNGTKIVHNVEKFIIFNLLKSELRYCNPFWNGSGPRKTLIFFDFNWLPWQRPLRNQKRGRDRSYSNKYLSLGAKIAKIGQVDPEIICLHLKKKKLTQAKYIARSASVPSGLNKEKETKNKTRYPPKKRLIAKNPQVSPVM